MDIKIDSWLYNFVTELPYMTIVFFQNVNIPNYGVNQVYKLDIWVDIISHHNSQLITLFFFFLYIFFFPFYFVLFFILSSSYFFVYDINAPRFIFPLCCDFDELNVHTKIVSFFYSFFHIFFIDLNASRVIFLSEILIIKSSHKKIVSTSLL